MRMPSLLSGAALLLWGWQADLLLVGLLLASLLEISRLLPWRWHFEAADLNRAWDLCSILFIGAAIYLYSSEELTRSGFTLIQWLPMIFFPMIAAQAFGSKELMDLRTFSWLLRDKEGRWLNRQIDIGPIYFAVCLLAASVTSKQSGIFYIAFVLLAGWALWHWRPLRFSNAACSIVILAVGFSGHFAHQKLQQLQGAMDAVISRAFAFMPRRNADNGHSYTAIGQIGRLKLSGRIVWRLQAEGSPPQLLREASFNLLRNTVWHSSIREFSQVPLDHEDFWVLLEGAEPESSVTIAGNIKRRGELLPLPNATIRLNELPVYELQQTRLGAVRTSGGPPFVRFKAFHNSTASIDAEPGMDDLHLPDDEIETVDKIVEQLGLRSLTLDQKLATIADFFQDNFSYSSYISREHVDPTGARSPLAMFLENARSGHCEYFATATVLLLRAAGEPARYATGFAVTERSRQSNTYLVRERHAHAWTLVHRDGMWQDFDTTPASWNSVEDQRAPGWEPLSDFLSTIRFHFSKWRWGKESHRNYLMWAMAPLAAMLAWRIVSTKYRVGSKPAQAPAIPEQLWPGHDSEFYSVTRQIAERFSPPLPGETLSCWIERVNQPDPSAQELLPILQLHYRYRFDPAGISSADRLLLRVQAAELIRSRRSRPPGH
jgi:protein-glutamine gamma-glutamyltransferase